jgi:hypothetical protein
MSSLPEPVQRFVELVSGVGTPTISTLVLETDAWMRRPKLPPIPLAIRMSHRLGEAFVHRICVGRGPCSIPFGMDAFVDGHGLMKIGPAVEVGPTYDEGALIAMWGEALVFPSAWLHRRDVRWDAVDADTAVLVVSAERGEIPLTVAFDSSVGFPVSCEADRPRGAGPRAHWTGRWSRWRPTRAGILAPSWMNVQWADEARPWLELRVTSIELNGPVERDLADARRVLAAASTNVSSTPGTPLGEDRPSAR